MKLYFRFFWKDRRIKPKVEIINYRSIYKDYFRIAFCLDLMCNRDAKG